MSQVATNPSITKYVELEATTCWCGVAFAVEKNFLAQTRERKGSIYCPLGHEGVYGRTREMERLKAELEAKQAELERQKQLTDQARQETERVSVSNRALRGVVTRTKNRVVAGVCPVQGCKRHFTNLQRHVSTKHPHYKKQDIG